MPPPTGQPAVSGGEEPRRYPKIKGGGEVPFTPDNAPPVTHETLKHIIIGTPIKKGRFWSGGHGPGAGKGKAEFPEDWDKAKIKTAIEQLLVVPDEIERKGSTLFFRGRVFGQDVEARARGRQGRPSCGRPILYHRGKRSIEYMDAEELATRLLATVAPGDAVMQRLIDVGEPLAAIIDLMEKAATERVAVSVELLAEVQQMVNDGDFDEVDTRSVNQDLATLRRHEVSRI